MTRHLHDESERQSKARRGSRKGGRKWRTMFLFTRKSQVPLLIFAILLSAVAGLLPPAMAIIFGRYFQAFSDYTSGNIDGPALMDKTMNSIYALMLLGLCAFSLKGGMFASWLAFGELQAKVVREQLFQALLDREISWYDERTMGVGTLLARLQTYDTRRQIPSPTN